MSRRLGASCAAEGIGAFAIVFFGCGTAATVTGPAAHLTINLVFGATVAAMIYALGHLSGAHFNPAVSIGFAAAGRFPRREIWPYALAQCAGAIAASTLHAVFIPAEAAASHFGSTTPVIGMARAVSIEVILTFFLMLVIISVATDHRAATGFAGLAIGTTVALCGLFGGPLTGCSMNPARSLAPALFAGPAALSVVWIYVVGPIAGAIAAARAYEWLRVGEPVEAEAIPVLE